jgi:uncharacterized phage-associated protein
MPYKPSHVANSFLVRAHEEGITDVDPLKIQKLVYYFHGWFLATRNIAGGGELFEAWPYGPVLPSLYRQFRANGARPIEGYAVDVDPGTGDSRALMVNPTDTMFKEVFDRVWDRYKNVSGLQLSSLTHAPGTPWDLARRRHATYLSDDEIMAHFRKLAVSDRSHPSSR